MRTSDILRLCLDNLKRRKGRTALTVIGVMIGTFSIVVMVSLGVGMTGIQEAQMESYGDLTKITMNNRGNGEEKVILNDDTVMQIKKLENVAAVSPTYSSYQMQGMFYAGKKDKYQAHVNELIGMDVTAIEAFGIDLLEGEYLDSGMNGKKIPIIVGEELAYSFEDTTKSYRSGKRYADQYKMDANGMPVGPFVDIMNDKIMLRFVTSEMSDSGEYEEKVIMEYELEIVGVMKGDYSAGWMTFGGVLLDIEILKDLEKKYAKETNNREMGYDDEKGYDQLSVKVDDVDNVESAEQAIHDLGYKETYSMVSEREESQKFSQMIQLVLGGIGAISLLVAAIGIANTMTMSIYERTREIGIMKVLGSKLIEIRKMFLIEAAIIGLLGGVTGVVLSFGASFAINILSSGLVGGNMGMGDGEALNISVIPVWLVLLGFCFSIGVGLLSGLAPANKAVKISALEAIRHE